MRTKDEAMAAKKSGYKKDAYLRRTPAPASNPVPGRK